jgi:hypothetical protein
MLHRLSTKSHAQQSLKTQVRWEKQYDHKHSTSHWTWENRMVRFPKPDGPVLADELQRLYFNFRMFRFAKPDVPVFTG